MYTSASNRKISDLMVDYGEERLKPNPDFQRRLVWTDKDKSNFIDTILKGFPFPEIFLAKGNLDTKTGKSVTWVVDGQQRVTTIYEYFSGSEELILSKHIKKYADLSEREKTDFLNYDIAVRDLGSVSLDEVKEIFRIINSTSYNLNAMEINNAFYNGPLKTLADEIAASDFFEEHEIFSLNDVRRMNDTLFILNILITCMSSYYSSNSNVEDYLIMYNSAFPKSNKLHQDILSVLETINKMKFSESSRAWNKADFFTLAVEIYKALHKDNKQIKIKDTAERIKRFYSEVDEASKQIRAKEGKSTKSLGEAAVYYDSAAQASTSKKNREKRAEIIRSKICFE